MAKSASATDMFPFSGADEPLLHGGDLAAARRLFPDAPEPFIDLSTGINPNPYPLPRFAGRNFCALARSRPRWSSSPAPRQQPMARRPRRMLCRRRARRFCCRWSAALLRPGRAAILTPTYSEHARAAALAGHAVAEVRDIGAIGNAELVVVTNPNNPDGRLLAKSDLLALAKALQPRGGMLVVDEAFMDVGPPRREPRPRNWRAATSWCCARSANSSGLPGCGSVLRWPRRRSPRGYRRCSARGRFRRRRSLVGAKALADRAWIEKSRRSLAEAATRLDAILSGAGLDIVGGTTLFRLARTRCGERIVPSSRTRRHSDARYSPIMPRGCALACRRASRIGSACRLRWPRFRDNG